MRQAWGVFRKVLGTSICYGGPSTKVQALEIKKGLERQMSFRNESELRARRFSLERMTRGLNYLYWDGITRENKG